VNQPSHGTHDDVARDYDALLYVSFGGPEGQDDVIPFLENVTRGREVTRERLEEVAEHYYRFGGVSPINEQNRAVIRNLEEELAAGGLDIPVYWGNRNWHPLLTDTMTRMKDDGVRRSIAFVTSAWSSYSGCHQYLDDIERARDRVGIDAPVVDKLRHFFNHPGFIEPQAERVRSALTRIPPARRNDAHLVFSAHSIPVRMAETSSYVAQLHEASRLVTEAVEGGHPWTLVYQSRSGPPQIPWLEPDVCEHLEKLSAEGIRDVVLVPIGFVSDHIEVRYDLDVEAAQVATDRGLNMVRAGTVGTHPAYIRMIKDLVVERMQASPHRPALGRMGASHDICALDCCPFPAR
jgi:protoporphyrin/coproporphyrin ferrochelatase